MAKVGKKYDRQICAFRHFRSNCQRERKQVFLSVKLWWINPTSFSTAWLKKPSTNLTTCKMRRTGKKMPRVMVKPKKTRAVVSSSSWPSRGIEDAHEPWMAARWQLQACQCPVFPPGAITIWSSVFLLIQFEQVPFSALRDRLHPKGRSIFLLYFCPPAQQVNLNLPDL